MIKYKIIPKAIEMLWESNTELKGTRTEWFEYFNKLLETDIDYHEEWMVNKILKYVDLWMKSLESNNYGLFELANVSEWASYWSSNMYNDDLELDIKNKILNIKEK